MIATLAQIERQALALPTKQRALLVDSLQQSLDNTGPGISHQWRAEIDRRCREIEDGAVKLIPGERAIREARSKMRQSRRK